MESPDNRLYMCTKCYCRCLWKDLSRKQHRCPRCCLPNKICIFCDKIFEPREQKDEYCKRCTFYIEKHAAFQPPQLGYIPQGSGANVGGSGQGSSLTARWQEFMAVSGLDANNFSDSD
ncbi:hypothetical protein KR084_003023 [Drosophila pseudotakahashii]|nr:hypothetical protein KR084_003023 [Drosophila pseudotakahashii]